MASAAPTGGGGTTSLTPSPAPSTVPGASPIPLTTGDYATQAATAQAAYQQALSQINSQRQQALSQFGYTGTIDPSTGQITGMSVDPNNPFGQYQQMLGQGALAQQASQADAASRNIGALTGARGGGLAAQGLTADKLAFGANSANLGSSLMGTLGDLSSQQQGAADTMNNALWNAELASAQQAIQSQYFDPANFSGVTDQGVAGSDPTSYAPSSLSGTPKMTTGTSAPALKKTPGGAARGNTFHRAVATRSKSRRKR